MWIDWQIPRGSKFSRDMAAAVEWLCSRVDCDKSLVVFDV